MSNRQDSNTARVLLSSHVDYLFAKEEARINDIKLSHHYYNEPIHSAYFDLLTARTREIFAKVEEMKAAK